MNDLLLRLYLKRYLKEGRAYFLMGLIMPLFFLVFFTIVGERTGGGSGVLKAFSESLGLKDVSLYLVVLILPYIAPVFTVVGTMAAPAFYVEDKDNGFFEFILSSTKFSSKDIFWAIVLTAVIVAAITIAVAATFMLIVVFVLNGGIPINFLKEILVYTIPISIIAALIGTSVAFASQALTKRISFVNSPAGLAPVFGVIVVIVPLFISVFSARGVLGTVNFNQLYLILGIYVACALVLFLIVFLLTTMRMVRERFLA
ncbi:MAG TPA: hypothetical protein VKU79_02810 [Thermoplasmataceae archaeon]|nr:hypothetical protein [Thermoplasmatales archaeon AK]HLH85778.1 hypothetical protein [Thermoplasmataceae archaeon]